MSASLDTGGFVGRRRGPGDTAYSINLFGHIATGRGQYADWLASGLSKLSSAFDTEQERVFLATAVYAIPPIPCSKR